MIISIIICLHCIVYIRMSFCKCKYVMLFNIGGNKDIYLSSITFVLPLNNFVKNTKNKSFTYLFYCHNIYTHQCPNTYVLNRYEYTRNTA